MKKHHFLSNYKQYHSRRGDELKELEPNHIYGCVVQLKDQVKDERGVNKNQWGIIVTGDDPTIAIRTYNVTAMSRWDDKEYYVKYCHAFEALPWEVTMAKLYSHNSTLFDRLKHMTGEYGKLQSSAAAQARVLSHPLHRIADWLINVF